MADSSGQNLAIEKPGALDLGRLQEYYRKAKGVRQRFEPNWYLDLAFFLGNQWLRWAGGRLNKPRLADWRRTPTDNRILPLIVSRVARKVKHRPTFQVMPETTDEDDLESARIGERLLEADWEALNLRQRLWGALIYADICGAGFWKIYWDPTKGKSGKFLYDPGQEDYARQENGQPVRADAFAETPGGLEQRTLAQGDVCVEVVSPFELYPDPLATSLDDAEWVIEEKVRSVEYVKHHYNVELPTDAPAPIGPIESRMGPSQSYGGGGEAEEYKGIKVYEAWIKPCTTYERGARFVWAADQILLTDEAPHDPMPYVMFTGIETPQRFWPAAIGTQLRSPQVDLNKLVASTMENAMRLGNPSLLKSRHANVAYSGIPGEEVLYDSTVPDAIPSFLIPPEIPQYVREQMDRIVISMQEIAGQREVSNATVPAGVTAASAINLLQEADDNRLTPEVQAMEDTLGRAGTKILRNRAIYNTDERLVRLAGEEGNWDIFAFKTGMITEEPTVVVQGGSAMPRSKAAKQAAMLEVLGLAFQYGVEFDERDLRRFFKDYEVAALERLFETIGADEREIQRENQQLMQGLALPLNEWDDDGLHIAGHDEVRKSARFKRLPPPVQEIFNTHVRAHQEHQVQVINTQLTAQQNEMGGGVPQEGMGAEPEEPEGPPQQ